jgi:hypothetical protein
MPTVERPVALADVARAASRKKVFECIFPASRYRADMIALKPASSATINASETIALEYAATHVRIAFAR